MLSVLVGINLVIIQKMTVTWYTNWVEGLTRPKVIMKPVESPLVKGVGVVLENLVVGPLVPLKLMDMELG